MNTEETEKPKTWASWGLFNPRFLGEMSTRSKGLFYGPRVPKSKPGRVLVANGTLRLNNMKSRLRAQRRRGIVTARQQRKHIKAIRREAGIANYAP